MSAALALARDAGITVALEADGRITWQASRSIEPSVLGDLRARREEIRRALIEAASAGPPVQQGGGAAANARALGWQVEIRPSGILVDTRGRPSDSTMLAQLEAILAPCPGEDADESRAPWPSCVMADPAEVVLRGELHEIERENER